MKYEQHPALLEWKDAPVLFFVVYLLNRIVFEESGTIPMLFLAALLTVGLGFAWCFVRSRWVRHRSLSLGDGFIEIDGRRRALSEIDYLKVGRSLIEIRFYRAGEGGSDDSVSRDRVSEEDWKELSEMLLSVEKIKQESLSNLKTPQAI